MLHLIRDSFNRYKCSRQKWLGRTAENIPKGWSYPMDLKCIPPMKCLRPPMRTYSDIQSNIKRGTKKEARKPIIVSLYYIFYTFYTFNLQCEYFSVSHTWYHWLNHQGVQCRSLFSMWLSPITFSCSKV